MADNPKVPASWRPPSSPFTKLLFCLLTLVGVATSNHNSSSMLEEVLRDGETYPARPACGTRATERDGTQASVDCLPVSPHWPMATGDSTSLLLTAHP